MKTLKLGGTAFTFLLTIFSLPLGAQECEPFLFLNCPEDNVDEQSFVDGFHVQVNGATNGICGPDPAYSEWDWGDDSPVSSSYFPATHTYDRPGDYTLTVSVGGFTEQCHIRVPGKNRNAQIFKPVFCPFFVYVEPGVITPALPGGYGVMVTNLNADKGKLLITGSGNDEGGATQILNCQGAVQEGETIYGFDALNPSAGFVEAIVASAYEACVASNIAFPGSCKGRGTFVVTGEDVGANCNFGQASTRDWQQVTSTSGQYNLKCKADN